MIGKAVPTAITRERRVLFRAEQAASEEYRAVIRAGAQDWPARIINLHCKGGCIESEWILKSNGAAADALTLSVGNRQLTTVAAVRWIWWSDARAGFMLRVPESISAQTRLFEVTPHFAPTLSVADPVNPDWVLFGRVMAISTGSLSFETSLSNRHLLPGLSLKGCVVRLPCLPDIVLDLIVLSVELVGSCLKVLADFAAPARTHRETLYRFSLFGMAAGARAFLPDTPARAPRRFGSGIRIETLTSTQDYERILELRRLAYSQVGIITDAVTTNDFADEYDARSVIILAKLNGELLGTARLIRADGPDERFLFEKDIPFSVLGPVSRSQFLEASRLAVHPDFQGSEVVLRLFQELARQTILANRCAVALARTEQRKSYRQFGWRSVSHAIPHPLLSGQTLRLMRITPREFLAGSNMSATAFQILVPPVASTLLYANVIDHQRLPLGQPARLALERAMARAIRRMRQSALVKVRDG